MTQAQNPKSQDSAVRTSESDAKRPYTPPELKEHGSVQEVTLQTFFGSFSPTPPPP